MIDILMLLVLAVVAYCVASEGAWGAGLILLSVILGGLLAMNFFEPLAGFLESNFARSLKWRDRWDFIALMGLFCLFVGGLRMLTLKVAPTDLTLIPALQEGGRWVCGLLTGYIAVGFFLTALHTAPIPREFLGFTPEQETLFGMKPDRQWLAFTQHASEKVFPSGRIFDATPTPRWALTTTRKTRANSGPPSQLNTEPAAAGSQSPPQPTKRNRRTRAATMVPKNHRAKRMILPSENRSLAELSTRTQSFKIKTRSGTTKARSPALRSAC